MEKIKHKILVMSGKGGVGKSTVSANLAYGLALEGYKVGILDADLHGPNIPLMFGLEGKKLGNIKEAYKVHDNLKLISLSFFLEKSNTPVVWRGPKKIGALRQLLTDIEWGELDYLVVDLPPGTGDEALTTAQDIKGIDGTIIVTTPQEVALLDSSKAVSFSKMLNLNILGIVENMSGFVCPHCGERIDIFKEGGGEKAAKDLNINFLGKIPMTPEIVNAGDNGKPYIYYNNGGIAVEALKKIVDSIIIKTQEGEEEKMKEFKIAFPTNDKETVESHFGHCKNFAIYNVRGSEVESLEFIDAPAHEPGLLPRFLGGHKITTIITGGMGQKAIDLFKEQNIDVILGATGNMKLSLDEYLKGELASTGSACSHNHEEGHTCSH